jgi:dTDP-4-dehydrorhamnose reductase
VDLTRPRQVDEWFARNNPGLVVNCAAFTAVDLAESHPEEARAINAGAVACIAKVTHGSGARLVTFSTDYVFDGSKNGPYVESDTPNPLNVYGSTKLEGERVAQQHNPEALIVRTSWLMSATHRNFATTILELLTGDEQKIEVVDDQRGKPTLADDLVTAVMLAVGNEASGILHLTNSGVTSWYGLAREIADIAGLDDSRIVPVTSDKSQRPARRPANSVLDSERLEQLSLHALPPYRPSLELVVERQIQRLHG